MRSDAKKRILNNQTETGSMVLSKRSGPELFATLGGAYL